mmetsp:Transcript_99228/g.309237  ORF Transcript_99228/g.309237 Transcript_99228/m.309237 type:complete len:306 (-) Transcript_99228:1094-2011(-)
MVHDKGLHRQQCLPPVRVDPLPLPLFGALLDADLGGRDRRGRLPREHRHPQEDQHVHVVRMRPLCLPRLRGGAPPFLYQPRVHLLADPAQAAGCHGALLAVHARRCHVAAQRPHPPQVGHEARRGAGVPPGARGRGARLRGGEPHAVRGPSGLQDRGAGDCAALLLRALDGAHPHVGFRLHTLEHDVPLQLGRVRRPKTHRALHPLVEQQPQARLHGDRYCVPGPLPHLHDPALRPQDLHPQAEPAEAATHGHGPLDVPDEHGEGQPPDAGPEDGSQGPLILPCAGGHRGYQPPLRQQGVCCDGF